MEEVNLLEVGSVLGEEGGGVKSGFERRVQKEREREREGVKSAVKVSNTSGERI